MLLEKVVQQREHLLTASKDLKAYFPVCDRVKESHIPEWLSDWPEWMPETGIGLEEHEK